MKTKSQNLLEEKKFKNTKNNRFALTTVNFFSHRKNRIGNLKMPGISYYVNVKGNIAVCVIIIIARLRIVENNKSLDDKNAFGLLLFHLNLMIRFRLKNRLNPTHTHTHTLLRGKYFFICIFMLCLLLLQLCGLGERPIQPLLLLAPTYIWLFQRVGK